MTHTPPPTEKKKTKRQEALEWVLAIAAGVLLALIVRTFCFTFARVEGTSMAPTLHDGQRVFVSIITEQFCPYERGDIVVFHYNSTTDYVKRIVALGGDKVKIENNTLYINGIAADEEYLGENLIYQDLAEQTVPEGEYFVLGDNRSLSHDSRYSDVGTITKEQILGKVVFSLFPFESY